jgi:nitrogen fixation protein FixH
MTIRHGTHTGREFTGRHMLIITVSFFAVVIAVNLTLAYFANSSWSGLVVQNSYVASQSFDKDMQIARRQHALGWQDQTTLTRDALQVALKDRDGLPLTGLSVRATLRRTVTELQDLHLKLNEGASGIYSTTVTIDPGVWEADVTAERPGQDAVRNVHRLVVD